MGWASGSGIAEDICRLVSPCIEDETKREKLIADIIKIFVDNDADDWDSDYYITYLKIHEPDEYKALLEEGEI